MIDNISSKLYDLIKNLEEQVAIYIGMSNFSFYAMNTLLDNEHIAKLTCCITPDVELTISSEREYQSCNNLDILLALQENENHKKIEFLSHDLGMSFFIIENQDGVSAWGLPNPIFDLKTLGIESQLAPTLIAPLPDSYAEQLLQKVKNALFNAENITAVIQLKVQDLLRHNNPRQQYLNTLNKIFQNEERLIAKDKIQRSGFFSSRIWSLLYDFQQDAVLGAIDKIEKYNGCIIADSVGLGKTFEALAVMKYYQERNKDILVLCPKRLQDNWNVYRQYDKRNTLREDRFNFELLYHTDLGRVKGKSGDTDLETFSWHTIDLLVIDESHNFRNNAPVRDRRTRYEFLMEELLKSGHKTKVLMLSATPVNNKLRDLKNQLYFITEEDDTGLRRAGIGSIQEVLRKAQSEFNKWSRNNENREQLIERLDGRYFKLLDILTIARSRKHIQQYYDVRAIGDFPERLHPINIEEGFDTAGEFPDIATVNNTLLRLNLAVYNPTKYILHEKKEEYAAKYDYNTKAGSIFRQEQREESLVALMRANYLKRLESSIHSFGISIERLLKKIEILIAQIEKFQDNRVELTMDFSITDEFSNDDLDPESVMGDAVLILMQDMDLIKFKDDLIRDREQITRLVSSVKQVTPGRDEKLLRLKDTLSQKHSAPINPGNHKVLIFSAFSDTAGYLYQELATWLFDEHGLRTGLITGGSKQNRTNLPGCDNEFNEILINFSPISKKRENFNSSLKDEIDILIASDCISEGQNLQDCDYLINYDIHWNPVRIVQRFGRIDRLGSKNKRIQLVNFWPNVDLNTYINLIDRVKGRMQIVDVSGTGDENIIDSDAVGGELKYRTQQLQALKNRVLDLDDLKSGISITDLTFNDFKTDLDHLTDTERTLLAHMIRGMGVAVKSRGDLLPKGVIFTLREIDTSDKQLESNALYPYYLVYLKDDGTPHHHGRQPKKTLDALRSLCLDTGRGSAGLQGKLEKSLATKKGLKHYRTLLSKTFELITQNRQASAIDSLATPGGTSWMGNDNAVNRYVVVNYCAVL